MNAPIATAISGTATSRMVRRRLRENFLPGALAASGFASTVAGASVTTLRVGSAIFLHVFVLRVLAGDCGLQIFAGDTELREPGIDRLRVDAGQHLFGDLLDLLGNLLNQRPR